MTPVIVEGVVVRGLQAARTLGFPTINLKYSGDLRVPVGVYAARVRVAGGRELLGAAIVGGDFKKSDTPKLEVHLFDDGVVERYDETVHVTLIEWVSELEKISDVARLREKILRDIELIKKYFAVCSPEL